MLQIIGNKSIVVEISRHHCRWNIGAAAAESVVPWRAATVFTGTEEAKER